MKKLISIFCITLSLCGATEARELGHYVPGVVNIRDLAVPPKAGFYYAQYNAHYSTDTYKDRNGNSVNSIGAIDVSADVDVTAVTPVFMWVTDKKVLGGDYAFYVAPTIANNSLAATVSRLNQSGEFTSDTTNLGDLYIQPLWLAWSDKKYDLSLGAGLYVPIGKYDDDANDNIGLGFWTGQIQGAGYLYLDEQKASALMLAGTYEMHSTKRGTDIRAGDHFTLEYGFSQYLSQQLEVGISGYSQWQVEGDKGNDALLDSSVKTEVHGAGLQLSYWFTPQLNLSAKYMKEYDAKARFEGDWMMLNIIYLPDQ